MTKWLKPLPGSDAYIFINRWLVSTHSDGTLLNPAHSFRVQGQFWLGSYCYNNLNRSEYSVDERVQTTFSSDIRPWEATGFTTYLSTMWSTTWGHTAHIFRKVVLFFFFFTYHWVLSFTFSLYHSGMFFHFAEYTSMPAAAATATYNFLFS